MSTDHLNAKSPPGQAPPVSVVILSVNEEVNIADCLRTCAWCDDVHVLDSGSTDRTPQIARDLGAQVHANPFKSFGQQRNWAIDNIPTKHPWHFHLDADERFRPQLVAEMLKELGPDGSLGRKAAYLVPSQMIFMNKWLKYSGGYPAYQVRLFHKDRCRFMDFGHGQREQTTGEVATLVQPYLHYNFSKGLCDWLSKHNRYSSHEASEAVALRGSHGSLISGLLNRDPLQRRRALKSFSYRLAGRAFWRFLYMYVLRGGWLDAIAGFHYCTMISMYEYWTELKIRERESDWRQRTDRLAERMLAEPAP